MFEVSDLSFKVSDLKCKASDLRCKVPDLRFKVPDLRPNSARAPTRALAKTQTVLLVMCGAIALLVHEDACAAAVRLESQFY